MMERLVDRRNYSAVINEALQWQLQRIRAQALLQDHEEHFGPVPPEELEKARKDMRKMISSR